MHDNISSIFGNSETRARQCIVNANLFLITANYICLIPSHRLSGRKPMKLQPDYWFTFEGSHQLIVFLYWVICTFIAIVIHFAHFVNMIIINKQFSLAFFFHPSKSQYQLLCVFVNIVISSFMIFNSMFSLNMYVRYWFLFSQIYLCIIFKS